MPQRRPLLWQWSLEWAYCSASRVALSQLHRGKSNEANPVSTPTREGGGICPARGTCQQDFISGMVAMGLLEGTTVRPSRPKEAVQGMGVLRQRGGGCPTTHSPQIAEGNGGVASEGHSLDRCPLVQPVSGPPGLEGSLPSPASESSPWITSPLSHLGLLPVPFWSGV